MWALESIILTISSIFNIYFLLISGTATFRGNNFQGSMPESVCDNRVPNGLLNILTADCAGDNPKVECDCCSSCF